MMKNVVIFGTEDLAELAHYYFENDPECKGYYNIVGFTVNKQFIKEDKFKGLPVFPFEELEKHFPAKSKTFGLNKLFAPIASNRLREKIYNEGLKRGYNFDSYISSKCTNLATSIGYNCFILEDNTLQPFTKIGNNNILWSGNHVGHHSIIEDNCFITSHVVISGHCQIKKGSFLGVNSTLRDGITIGENSVVGMGSVVTKNVPNNQTWIGSPAKDIFDIKK